MIRDLNPGDNLPFIEKDIDQDRINKWARLSGDFNLLHVDPEYARNTPFKGTIAHGPMSLAFLNELMMACFGEQWASGGKLIDVRFISPVRPGDRIRIGGKVTECLRNQGDLIVEADLFIEKKDGEKAVVGKGICRISQGGRNETKRT
jgi:3-hydroxybutyryl-CoA dehydratase